MADVSHAAVSVVGNLAMVEANRAAIIEGKFVPFLLSVNGGIQAATESDGGPGVDAATAGVSAVNYPLLEASLQTLYMLCYPSELRSLILAQGGTKVVELGLTSGSYECKRWALWVETVLK